MEYNDTRTPVSVLLTSPCLSRPFKHPVLAWPGGAPVRLSAALKRASPRNSTERERHLQGFLHIAKQSEGQYWVAGQGSSDTGSPIKSCGDGWDGRVAFPPSFLREKYLKLPLLLPLTFLSPNLLRSGRLASNKESREGYTPVSVIAAVVTIIRYRQCRCHWW